jgi:hypothetical protein
MSAPPSHSLWLFGLSIIPIVVPAGCFARMARPLDLVGSSLDGSGLQDLVFLSTPEFRN